MQSETGQTCLTGNTQEALCSAPAWISVCKKNEIGIVHHKKKEPSKWIKDLNRRAKNIKFIEENIGESLYDIGFNSELRKVSREWHAASEVVLLPQIKHFKWG